MRQQHSVVLALAFIVALGGAAQAALVAWWPFDEAGGSVANDASGSVNLHNATLNGSNPAFAPGAGKFGGALWLPGVDEYAQAVDHADFEFPAEESFTAALWYKRNGVENDQGLITKGYHDTSRNVNYWMLQTRSNGFTYDSRKGTGGTPRVRLDAGGNHGDNQWHHFVVVRDSVANELRLYVDNDPTPLIHNMGTGDGNGDWDVGVHGDPLVIGNHHNRYTQGYFDDIGIWKGQALTAAEIDTIYNNGIAGLAGPPPPPPAFMTPVNALADLNRTGPGNPGLVSGSVQATIDPWGFPGGNVDLGENPSDLDGSRLAYWYLKPSSQGSGAYPPQSLYYDLGEAVTVDQLHLWWSDRDAPNITGRITDMDIDYLPLSAAQPGTFDLSTMQGLTGWLNAVAAYDPSAGSFGVQQDLDPADFLTRYIRLTMNASGYGGSNGNQWGGLRQIGVTRAIITIIPEPSTFLIWSLGLLGLAWVARRRKA